MLDEAKPEAVATFTNTYDTVVVERAQAGRPRDDGEAARSAWSTPEDRAAAQRGAST